MNTQEHIVALIEPTPAGEAPLAAARAAVDRGGRATVVVLLGNEAVRDIRAFAESEDLGYLEAKEIFAERLSSMYAERVGGNTPAVVAWESASRRMLLSAAWRAEATTLALPQGLARRAGWRSAVSKSPIPILIAPPLAA